MTREAILKEIQFLPDEMLEAIWRMIVASRKSMQSTINEPDSTPQNQTDDFWEEAKNYQSVNHPELNQQSVLSHPKPGIAKGGLWMSDDFDEPLEEMQEYMY